MALGLFDGAGRMRYRSRHTRGLNDLFRELRRESLFWREVITLGPWLLLLAAVVIGSMVALARLP